MSACLETHRRLYNSMLRQRMDAYESDGTTLTFADQCRSFTQQRETNPYYKGLSVAAAQPTIKRLERAFDAFFRRLKAGEKPGYPRFKSLDRFDSFTFRVHGNGCKVSGSDEEGFRLYLKLDGLDRRRSFVKINRHRPWQGCIKTVTVKREADKWYVVLSCDLGDVKVTPSDKPAVGIDVGLESFLTTSDYLQIKNPRYLKAALPALRKAQRSVSRKTRMNGKGSKRRRKAVRRVAKLHARVKNLRRDHHHKIALKLVRRYGKIAAENLNIQGMLRNRRLSRAIADVAWGGFLLTLRCKAEGAGSVFVAVCAPGTSQDCSRCGEKVRKRLSQRRHDCPYCGLSLHRDHNAARNILARGVAAWTGPSGDMVAIE